MAAERLEGLPSLSTHLTGGGTSFDTRGAAIFFFPGGDLARPAAALAPLPS